MDTDRELLVELRDLLRAHVTDAACEWLNTHGALSTAEWAISAGDPADVKAAGETHAQAIGRLERAVRTFQLHAVLLGLGDDQ